MAVFNAMHHLTLCIGLLHREFMQVTTDAPGKGANAGALSFT